MFTSKVCVLACGLLVSCTAQWVLAAPGFAASTSDLGMDSYWPRAFHVGESFALETPPAVPSVELLAPLPPAAARETVSSNDQLTGQLTDQITDQATEQFEQEVTDQEPDYPAGFTLKSIEEIIYVPEGSEVDSLPQEHASDEEVAVANADAENEILTDAKASIAHSDYEPRQVEGDPLPPSDYYYDYARANDWFMRYLKFYEHQFTHEGKYGARMPGTDKDRDVLAWQRVRREASPSEYSANSGDATGSYSGASAFAGSGTALDLSRMSFPGYDGVPEFTGSELYNPEILGPNYRQFAAGMLSLDPHQVPEYETYSPDLETSNYSPPQFGGNVLPAGLQSRIGGGGETVSDSGENPAGTGISASIEGRSKGSFASSSSSDDGSGKKTLSVRTGHF